MTTSRVAYLGVLVAAGLASLVACMDDTPGLGISEPESLQALQGNRPPVAEAGGPYQGIVGASVQFNGSASSDPDGPLSKMKYRWTFGDGSTGSLVSPTHVYAQAGTYVVTLTVTDAKKATSTPDSTTATITAPPTEEPVNQPPVAAAGGAYSGLEGGTIQFDGTGSADPDGDVPLSYAWSYGDGNGGVGVAPAHRYADNGSFVVTLTVTDTDGATGTDTGSVSIENLPPTVNAGPDRSVQMGEDLQLAVTFSDAGFNDGPWSYEVDWGDGTAAASGSLDNQAAEIAASHAFANPGAYVVAVALTDKDGGRGTASLTASVNAPPPAAEAVLLAAGNIARCTGPGDEATAALLDGLSGIVVALGDNAYPSGSRDDYRNCYEPNWGRHRNRTRPAAGNHEYDTGSAAPYFEYFGAAAGDPSAGYYSYDLGTWHIIVLNSNCAAVGGCFVGSPQDQWLRADLAANPAVCTLAYWHHPRFYQGDWGINASVKPFWDVLYAAGADVILGAHHHLYERYAPQTPAGVQDAARGIRQFTVGTGGYGHDQLLAPRPTVEARDNTAWGVLRLTLDPEGYSWEFVPVAGQSFTDSGSGTCH